MKKNRLNAFIISHKDNSHGVVMLMNLLSEQGYKTYTSIGMKREECLNVFNSCDVCICYGYAYTDEIFLCGYATARRFKLLHLAAGMDNTGYMSDIFFIKFKTIESLLSYTSKYDLEYGGKIKTEMK